ncbi:MAG: hypothetical protein H0T84_00220 [Tatlockia sp.]|nr:hypothetical protein [Tatlockia sp.]
MLFKSDQTLEIIMENKEEMEKFILKINFIKGLIDRDADFFTIKEKLENKAQIQEIFEVEDNEESALAQLLEDIDGEKLEKPLTKTTFFDAIIDDWFQSKVVGLMFAGEMPKDGHDPKDDFLNFTFSLAEKMKLADLKVISPEHQIWNELFRSNDPNIRRGLNACPLIVEGNKVKFADDSLIDYFIVRKSYEEFLDNENYEQFIK